jgi:hypothetical protein
MSLPGTRTSPSRICAISDACHHPKIYEFCEMMVRLAAHIYRPGSDSKRQYTDFGRLGRLRRVGRLGDPAAFAGALRCSEVRVARATP